ncbi:17051_t:CDS:2, partial [Gigaspora rosea]
MEKTKKSLIEEEPFDKFSAESWLKSGIVHYLNLAGGALHENCEKSSSSIRNHQLLRAVSRPATPFRNTCDFNTSSSHANIITVMLVA